MSQRKSDDERVMRAVELLARPADLSGPKQRAEAFMAALDDDSTEPEGKSE